jgi:hypothetical protein
MDPEKENAEPQIEKADETENSNENQPERETPVVEEPADAEAKPVEVPEGFVRKEEFDELDTKYRNSSSEALVWKAKAEGQDPRRELTNEPTESDLRAAFPEIDWEYADAVTKRLARESFQTRRIAEHLSTKENAREAERQWNNDLEVAIAKNPALQGQEAGFKEFANMPTHRGVSLDVLVDAYLQKTGTTKPTKPAPRPALENGNGGPRGPISPKKKYSGEEMLAIQLEDPRKYHDLLMSGEFDGD